MLIGVLDKDQMMHETSTVMLSDSKMYNYNSIDYDISKVRHPENLGIEIQKRAKKVQIEMDEPDAESDLENKYFRYGFL